MYKNITNLVRQIQNLQNLDNEMALRNVSGLLKLIPLIGGMIENNTIQLHRDIKLKEKLGKLERDLENIANSSNINDLMNFVEQNSLIFYSLFASQHSAIKGINEKMDDFLKRNLISISSSEDLINVNEKFLLVFISGPSAVGKDTLLNSLYGTPIGLYKSSDSEVLTKITTREKRNSDETYMNFVDSKKYEELLSTNKIIFPFSWGVHEYGFSKSQLSNAIKKPKILWCIGTEFDMLREAKNMLNELSVNNIFILLEASTSELIMRSKTRNLKEDDYRNRILAITKEVRFIKENDDLIKNIFDIRIHAGNSESVNSVSHEVKKQIEKYCS